MPAQQHGLAIKWSTINAPKPCGGIAENFTYSPKTKTGEVENEEMDLAAVALYGDSADWSFESTITDASTDFPDISEGAKVSLTGYADGTHLISEAVERWVLNQAKTGSIRGTHFPHVTGGTGAAAGSFTALSPEQTAPVILPASKVVWGTKGMTSTLGKVHGVTLTQQVKFFPEQDEGGEDVFVAVGGYRRLISIDVLVLAAAAMPVTGAILTLAGAPAHAANSFQVSGDIKFVKGKGAMMTLQGIWAPLLGLDDEEE